MQPRLLRRAFMAATVVWALALPVAAYAAGRASGSPVGALAAALPYLVGTVICHQRPERSFQLWAQPLPVCARCTGIYAGACLAVLAAAFGSAARVHRARVAFIVAALPTLATLAYEWSTADAPSNTIRALAALPLGAAIARVVLTAADDRVN